MSERSAPFETLFAPDGQWLGVPGRAVLGVDCRDCGDALAKLRA